MPIISAGLTNEYRLLLACARKDLTPEQLEEARSAIACGIDWKLLGRHADRHALSPLLHWNLRKHFPLAVAAPQQVRERIFEHNVGNLFLSGVLLNILAGMRAAGIRALAYKGPALAASLYGDVTLREMSDLDILVGPASLPAARKVLTQLGYEPTFKTTRKQEAARLHSDCELEFWSRDGKVLVDLHWRVTPPHLAARFSFEDFWRRRRDVTIGQKAIPTFSVEDTVLVLSVHGGKHLWPRLSWLADFAESLHSSLDWQLLRARARDARVERMLLLALALAGRILGVQAPPEFSAAIEKDEVVQNIAQDIASRFFIDSSQKASAQKETDQNPLRWAKLLQLADNRWDGVRCAVGFALSSGPQEWQAVQVPDTFFGLYPLLRIAGLLRSAPAFLFSRHREP